MPQTMLPITDRCFLIHSFSYYLVLSKVFRLAAIGPLLALLASIGERMGHGRYSNIYDVLKIKTYIYLFFFRSRYTLDSLPLSKRSMFFWWVMRIRAQMHIPYSNTERTGEWKRNTILNGKANPALIELSET